MCPYEFGGGGGAGGGGEGNDMCANILLSRISLTGFSLEFSCSKEKVSDLESGGFGNA